MSLREIAEEYHNDGSYRLGNSWVYMKALYKKFNKNIV